MTVGAPFDGASAAGAAAPPGTLKIVVPWALPASVPAVLFARGAETLWATCSGRRKRALALAESGISSAGASALWNCDSG